MKILIITNNMKLNSGWGRYSSSIVGEYKNMCFDIIVVTEKGQSGSDFENEKNVLLPISNFKIYNFILNIINIMKIARSCDVVHAFDGWPYGVYGYFSVLGTKKKLFINGVGTYSVLPLDSHIKGFLLKKAYKRASRIFCISNYVENKIFDRTGLTNIEVVHLGSTELPLLSKEEMDYFSDKFNIKKNNKPILLTVGAIKERKGQFDTLKASFLLKNKYPDYLYIMVGSDNDHEYLDSIKNFSRENRIDDNIKIISNVKSDKELAFFYQKCDIFLLNSNNDNGHFEGFGLVFLEAAQFGKPLIGSNNCGIEDAIESGYNGYLVAQKDTDDIYNAIMRVLNQKYVDFNTNSRKFHKRFSWESTALKYNKYY